MASFSMFYWKRTHFFNKKLFGFPYYFLEYIWILRKTSKKKIIGRNSDRKLNIKEYKTKSKTMIKPSYPMKLSSSGNKEQGLELKKIKEYLYIAKYSFDHSQLNNDNSPLYLRIEESDLHVTVAFFFLWKSRIYEYFEDLTW